MHSDHDVKNTFSQSRQYVLVHQHGDRNTEVSENVTELQVVSINAVPAGSQYLIVYCLWIPKPNLFPLNYTRLSIVLTSCRDSSHFDL